MWLGGPSKPEARKEWVELYQEGLEWLKIWSKQTKTAVITSQLAKTAKSHFNEMIWVESGRLRGVYDKMHLFSYGGEHLIFDQGKPQPKLFKPKGIKTGAVICYDIRFPELCRELTMNGARILVVSAQWPLSRRDHWMTLLRARAIENQVYVVAVNRLGSKRKEIFIGDSLVIDPWGETMLHLTENDFFGKVVLNLDHQDQVRKYYPFLKSRRVVRHVWK